MKFVETDTEGPKRDLVAVTPPRPEHRRVAVSAVLTVFVLTATVVTIYLVFPKRNNQLMTRAYEFHETTMSFDLEKPTRAQLATYALGLIGKVPWPARNVQIVGVVATSILDRPAVMVRYKIDGRPVSLVVQRARDALPRRHQRSRRGNRCESWRNEDWTFVAVGSEQELKIWHKALGVP